MGYLEANRFGYAIAGSHSSRTAEGDNAVLMNKVASELIQKYGKDGKTFIKNWFIGKFFGSNQRKLSSLLSQDKPDLDQLVKVMHTYYEYNMANLMLEMQRYAFQRLFSLVIFRYGAHLVNN
jgi:hypothetical protein